jgi:hypothetical protein
MTLRRLLSAGVLLALFAALAGAPLDAQEKKKDKDPPAKKKDDEKKDEKASDKDAIPLLALVAEAGKKNDYRLDPTHGGGKTSYEDGPKTPGLLVGLELFPGVASKVEYVRGAKPIFLRQDGKGTIRSTGYTHGWVGAGIPVKLEAKPGYAVGGFKVHTSFGVIQGMSLVFYRITETGLDKNVSYDSKYYGHNDPASARLVGGTGEPILGIHGMVAADAKSKDFGLGLIIMGKDKKKKKD